MPGCLDVLSCGHGHMTFNFDKDDPLETERASRVVQDMLRRGYALFIEGEGGKLHKVKKFDEKNASYIIAAGGDGSTDHGPESKQTTAPGRKGKAAQTAVPMRTSRATAIAPTAGG